jgi:hypothetical protein
MQFGVLYTHYCVVLFYNIFPFWVISQLYKIYNFAQLCGWFIAGIGVQHQSINQSKYNSWRPISTKTLVHNKVN